MRSASAGSSCSLRRLPSYQDEIQAWVTAELGLALDYTRLDGALGWRGPELAFRDVRVRTVGDATPFLTARGANVGFDVLDSLLRLATGREVAIDRLTFDGTEFTLVRTARRAYRLQGAPAVSGEQATVQLPPDVDVLVRNSRVLYLDAARSIAWAFQDVAGSLRRDDEVLTVELEVCLRRSLRIASRSRRKPSSPTTRRPMPARATRAVGGCRPISTMSISPLPPACSRRSPGAASGPRRRGVVARLARRHGHGRYRRGSRSPTSRCRAPSAPSIRASSSIALSANWQRTDEAWQFALRDVAVTRSGRAWPEAATVDIEVGRDADGVNRFALRSSFLRLEDLTPFFAPLQESRLLESWFALAPRGDLSAVDLALARTADAAIDYTVSADFAELGIGAVEGVPGVTGLTGQIRADSRAGRLELASGMRRSIGPHLFRGVLDVPELRGIVVWRAGQDAVRVVSDDLLVVTPDVSLRSNLELTLPMDDSSPELDLRTTLSEFEVAAVSRYLPVHRCRRPSSRGSIPRFAAGELRAPTSRSWGRCALFRSTAAKASFTPRSKSRTVSSRSSATGRLRRISTARSSSSMRSSRRAAAAACSATGRPGCASASVICAPEISRCRPTRSAGSIKCSRF